MLSFANIKRKCLRKGCKSIKAYLNDLYDNVEKLSILWYNNNDLMISKERYMKKPELSDFGLNEELIQLNNKQHNDYEQYLEDYIKKSEPK